MSTDILEGEKREGEVSSETSAIYTRIRTNYVISQKRVRLFFIVTWWETQICVPVLEQKKKELWI